MPYPNPANHQLTITSDKQISEIILYNSIGARCFHNSELSTNVVQLAVDTAPPGLYMVHIVYAGNNITIKRIIIQ